MCPEAPKKRSAAQHIRSSPVHPNNKPALPPPRYERNKKEDAAWANSTDFSMWFLLVCFPSDFPGNINSWCASYRYTMNRTRYKTLYIMLGRAVARTRRGGCWRSWLQFACRPLGNPPRTAFRAATGFVSSVWNRSLVKYEDRNCNKPGSL